MSEARLNSAGHWIFLSVAMLSVAWVCQSGFSAVTAREARIEESRRWDKMLELQTQSLRRAGVSIQG